MSSVKSPETSNQLLPEQFRNLERFAAQWSLQTERERNRRRLSSEMSEIQEFYDSMLPRMDEIMDYLNQYPLDGLAPEAKRLLYLTFSLAEVTPAVEQYGTPAVIDGFPPERFLPIDVPNMTPSES